MLWRRIFPDYNVMSAPKAHFIGGIPWKRPSEYLKQALDEIPHVLILSGFCVCAFAMSQYRLYSIPEEIRHGRSKKYRTLYSVYREGDPESADIIKHDHYEVQEPWF